MDFFILSLARLVRLKKMIELLFVLTLVDLLRIKALGVMQVGATATITIPEKAKKFYRIKNTEPF
ncbi:hypothetical protein JXQ31_17135 [candidate division KSB1 bacterium]|nr:hypothetical protein [candidate division KSB1 bacterium]